MSNSFYSELYSIKDLLKNERDEQDRNKNYYIPRYQRRYVWTKEHVLKLLEDIKDIVDKKSGNENFRDYFIGGIVLSKASIDGEERSRRSLEVIDGQQRLTTIALIIGILHKNLVCKKEEIVEKRVIDREALDQYISDLKQLIVKNIRDGRRNIRKIYSIERSDSLKEIFENLLSKLVNTPKDLCEGIDIEEFEINSNEYKRNLLEIASEVDEYLKQLEEEELLDFIDQLLDHTKIVVTKTKDIDTGFLVFEKLNDRGIALNPEDLLKNFLFYHASEDEYQMLTDKWERLIDEIGNINPSGRKMLPREFLEDYLIITGKEIPQGEHNQIFRAFKSLVRENDFNGSVELLDDLEKVALKYKNLKRDNIIKKYLNLLNFSLGYKILLSLFYKFGEEEFENRKKEFLYHVFRFGISYITANKTKKISELLPDVCKKIILSTNFDEIKMFLDNKIRYIGDEFKNNIITSFIGKKRNLSKLLLSISNYHLEGTKLDSGNITVEHILPQNPRWEECQYDEINEENYKNYLDRIGNLTLTDRSFNSQAKNACFREKMQLLLQNQNVYITRSILENIEEGSTQFSNFRQIFNRYWSPLNEDQEWGKKPIEKRSEAFGNLLSYILIDNNFKLDYFD